MMTKQQSNKAAKQQIGRELLALICCFAALLLCCCPRPARAQVLQGDWVQQSQRAIDQHRKTAVRVIVLDETGELVEAAAVTIEQRTRDFALGVIVPETGLPEPMRELPVWRCFNAVALGALTAWPRLQPIPNQWKLDRVEQVVERANRLGLRLRWGAVFSADAGRLPEWIVSLDGMSLRDAMDAHLRKVLDTFGRRVDGFDILTNSLDHHFIRQRLGQAMVRRLFEQAQAATAPAAGGTDLTAMGAGPTLCIRYEDALTPTRVSRMLARVVDLRQAFIPVDAVALEQRMGGVLQQAPLARAFTLIGSQKLDVIIASLEVGGASEAAAAVNLETFLRTAFSDPNVRGIYFAGLAAEDLMDPNAALLTDEGEPTEVGQTLEGLFRDLWWTHEQLTTDDRGNAYARVFAGTHRVTARLPGGRILRTTVHLPRRDPSLGPRIVLLEPMTP